MRMESVGREAVMFRPMCAAIPFILMENTEQQQFILCVDEESGFLGEDGERRSV